ncbi:MAG TPA: sigma-54 dependent transcriptional regulator, partial [Gemmatimonadaceae bacterium]|nr:sigma-54 dependent transcriptional regulator [Gemmatimonadaceae bacterium]
NDKLHRELMQVRHEREIVGDSAAVRRILQTLATVAPTRATVLIQGESGTGKELIARAIHDQSDRRHKPFIKLNCAALPDGLIESALFGHEKGAFTGAVKRVEGAFERANGGSLLLDEISEMKLELQAKLLRVLQEQEFERVGGHSPIRVDVRVIATTNRDLAARAAAGDFRQDLYYRLAVVPIVIPPLRDRSEDIPTLAYRFALATAAEIGKEFRGFAPEAMQLLQAYPWPGNVRELQHAVERAVILSNDAVLQPHAFDAQRLTSGSPLAQQAFHRTTPTGIAISVFGGGAASLPPNAVVLTSFNVDEAERILIERALQATGNNRTRTAELLGISVRTLRNKLNGPGAKANRIREVA